MKGCLVVESNGDVYEEGIKHDENVIQKLTMGGIIVMGKYIGDVLIPKNLRQLKSIIKKLVPINSTELPDLTHVYVGKITSFKDLFKKYENLNSIEGIKHWNTKSCTDGTNDFTVYINKRK